MIDLPSYIEKLKGMSPEDVDKEIEKLKPKDVTNCSEPMFFSMLHYKLLLKSAINLDIRIWNKFLHENKKVKPLLRGANMG